MRTVTANLVIELEVRVGGVDNLNVASLNRSTLGRKAVILYRITIYIVSSRRLMLTSCIS
jgi:hypothetical protein